jgi:D-xylose 1-dehydrogenase (NADP+, D-xylono-1,5-lactone-forming)
VAVRWGILSTARVAGALLEAARGTDAAEVVAVASRARRRAEALAEAWGIERAYGAYDELLADPDLDGVYVALPNSMHVEWSIRALEAGRHVLCEKPLARRAGDAEAAFDAADRRGLVLMEGLMFRHHPQTARLAELVRGGAVGRLRDLRASFSFTVADRGDVRLQPGLDGGALMDVGCYCVSASRLLAGEPGLVEGRAVEGGGGVDVRFEGALHLPEGVASRFEVALDLPSRHHLEAVGEEGSLRLADPWHCREPGIRLRRRGGSEWIAVEPADAHRLQLENASAAIRGPEAPLLGRDDAVAQARSLEALRRSAAENRPVAPGEAG